MDFKEKRKQYYIDNRDRILERNKKYSEADQTKLEPIWWSIFWRKGFPRNPSCFRAEPNQNGDKLSEERRIFQWYFTTMSGPLSRKNRPMNLDSPAPAKIQSPLPVVRHTTAHIHFMLLHIKHGYQQERNGLCTVAWIQDGSQWLIFKFMQHKCTCSD